MMNDIKYTGPVECSAVGGSNPVAAMIAKMMMSSDQLAVTQAQSVEAQSVGVAAALSRGGVSI